MRAKFSPSVLRGVVSAPPSKSMAHRYLIGAALSGEVCTLSGIDYSEDILASMDCLRALGARITIEDDRVTVDPSSFMQVEPESLYCRESGSTLRFFIPLALCLDKPVTFEGAPRLLERPLEVYEDLCAAAGFTFRKGETTLQVEGNLGEVVGGLNNSPIQTQAPAQGLGCKGGEAVREADACSDTSTRISADTPTDASLSRSTFELRGDVSSQFITGLIFALVHLNKPACIKILPPFESRSYIDLTLSALVAFGAKVFFVDDLTIEIAPAKLHGFSGPIEGDYSNAAFLDAFNLFGGEVSVENLHPESLQGDRVYRECFAQLATGTPTLHISDCPDLGPILIAVASLLQGATLTGTERLKAKESDRGQAMLQELKKLGGDITIRENEIEVSKQDLRYQGIPLDGHNDHRIVMACSVILSVIGGELEGIEAVRKSYPGFFEDIKSLGAKVEIQ